MDKNELKSMALLQRISQIVAQYENEMAEIRVQATVLDEELRKLKERYAAQEEPANETD